MSAPEPELIPSVHPAVPCTNRFEFRAGGSGRVESRWVFKASVKHGKSESRLLDTRLGAGAATRSLHPHPSRSRVFFSLPSLASTDMSGGRPLPPSMCVRLFYLADFSLVMPPPPPSPSRSLLRLETQPVHKCAKRNLHH